MTETILIVDDHRAYVETVALILRHHGFRVTAVTHPNAVLSHLAAQRPDLIVCDVKMPGMDGVTLARRIRDFGYQVPIMLMSGDAIPAIELPAVSFARKTTELDKLISLIERQLA
jgi:two-component system C4-dicarboxylate transport response regulator DctD